MRQEHADRRDNQGRKGEQKKLNHLPHTERFICFAFLPISARTM